MGSGLAPLNFKSSFMLAKNRRCLVLQLYKFLCLSWVFLLSLRDLDLLIFFILSHILAVCEMGFQTVTLEPHV